MADATPTIGWRKREDGMIVVWDLPAGAEYAPLPPAEQRRQIDAVEKQWGELCREIGQRHLLPDGWLQAMIWRESGGDPRAHSFDGGFGLLQITSPALKGNRTAEELFDPRTNVEIGARYISWLASLPGVKGDFPKVSAAFNAGSVQPTHANRWGMVSTGNHIDSEVMALNYWTQMQAAKQLMAASEAVANQFTEVELVGDDFDKPAGLSDDPPPTPRNT